MTSACKKSILILIVACAVLALSQDTHSQDKKEEKITDEQTKLNKALKDAATRGDIPKMMLYLKEGAKPNWNDPADYGKTALIRGIMTKKVAVVKVLVENGADIHFAATDGQKRYPLYFATVISSTEVVEYLLSKGAAKDLNRKPHLLGSICENRYSPAEMITLVVKAGADPNLLHKDKTPLVNAIEKGRADYVKALLEVKADVNWKDKKGKPTQEYALTQGSPEIIAMLKKAGAKE